MVWGRNKKYPLERGYFGLHFDFGIDAGGEGEILETLDGLGGGVADVDEAFVNFHLESFTTSLVDVWRFHDGESAALGW